MVKFLAFGGESCICWNQTSRGKKVNVNTTLCEGRRVINPPQDIALLGGQFTVVDGHRSRNVGREKSRFFWETQRSAKAGGSSLHLADIALLGGQFKVMDGPQITLC